MTADARRRVLNTVKWDVNDGIAVRSQCRQLTSTVTSPVSTALGVVVVAVYSEVALAVRG